MALATAQGNRAAAFPTKAETYGEKLMNFGKASYFYGGEAKIKTELSVTDRFIKGHKEDFGVNLYNEFAAAEDNEGFLPSDRQIRNVYDTCRQDLTILEQQRKAKKDEIVTLGGKRTPSKISTVQESYTANTAAVQATATPIDPFSNNNNNHGYSNPSPSPPMTMNSGVTPAVDPFPSFSSSNSNPQIRNSASPTPLSQQDLLDL